MTIFTTLTFVVVTASMTSVQALNKQVPLDRKAIVSRHNVVLTQFDGSRPIQVGNGEFAFGMDLTGCKPLPHSTRCRNGVGTVPTAHGQSAADFQGQVWDTHGRPIRYPMPDPLHPELSEWLAGNPHRINLGRIGFVLKRRDGIEAIASDLKNARQTLDLWNGTVTSLFEIDGDPVKVTTVCHPTEDSVAAKVESPLITAEGFQFSWMFWRQRDSICELVGDWMEPAQLDQQGAPQKGRADFLRKLDSDSYHVSLTWKGDAELLRPKPLTGSPIEIIDAEYGAQDKWLDVTDIAKKAVKSGTLRLRADYRLGPDPLLGVVKRLKVTFKADGKTQTVEVGENDEVRIHVPPREHEVTLQPTGKSDTFSFVCAFSPKPLPQSTAGCRVDLRSL